MSGFIAHDVAVQAATATLTAVQHVPHRHEPLADQCRRAAASLALNVAEGHGRTGRDRVHHWRIAYGSAREATVALDLLVAVAAVPPGPAQAAATLLDRSRALLWRAIQAAQR